MQPSLTAGMRFGVYEIVEPLGAGGMGEVYLARDTRLDRSVALKIIGHWHADDPTRLERFVREAKTASSLNHPNIAHVYEIGEANGVHFIVMEYVRGETLKKRIGSHGMPISDVVVYATQIADALDEAHHHGIIHRDLKPANAMITSRGKLKILDFGLAKIVAPTDETDSLLSTAPGHTLAGMVLGTLDYMSPEQVRGLAVDQRSDIFSFGVMVYEMIAGRLPFSGASKTDTVYRITQVQPDAVTRYNYDVPPDLDRIVRKCLEKQPSRRYQTVRDLLIDLSTLQRDSGSQPLVISAAAPSHWKLRWLLIGSLAAIGAASAAGAFFWLKPDVIDSIVVVPETTPTAGALAVELTDGVAASLANSLSQLGTLNVAPRQRAVVSTGAGVDTAAIAKRAGVHAVLVVRLVPRGEMAQLYLELLDAAHARMAWGQQYTIRINEIELAQESISAEVAETLRLRFNAEEQRAQEVFQLYQRGRYHTARRTESDIRRAIDFYQQAIDKDRAYGRAWAGLAEAYNLLPTYSAAPAEEMFPKAKAAAEQAIKLDDTLAEAHTQMGVVAFRWEWDWAAADREFARALALNPTHADGHYWASLFHASMRRSDEAMERIREAQAVEPLNPAIRAASAWVHYMAGRYQQAVSDAKRAVEADPKSVVSYRYLGLAQAQLGNFGEAVDALQTAVVLAPGATLHKAELAYALAVGGRRTEASTVLAELRAGHPKRFVSAYNFAVIAAGMGDVAGALDALETALRERANLLVWTGADPRLNPLRKEPRFLQLLKTLAIDVLPAGPSSK